MEISQELSRFFGPGPGFQNRIEDFARKTNLFPADDLLSSKRHLSRSVIPHVKALSSLYNRKHLEEPESTRSLAAYWGTGNSSNKRLSYFLSFTPPNILRTAAIWQELGKLGFRFPEVQSFKAVDFGSGAGALPCGIGLGESLHSLGVPSNASFAMIEQDRELLKLASAWSSEFWTSLNLGHWKNKSFVRKISFSQGLLPRSAPRFHLWTMGFFLNELEVPISELASQLLQAWTLHLENNGLVILMDSALRPETRKLLELRKELLLQAESPKYRWLKVLLPCLGHQNCGALEDPKDWCHETATWWRPPYLKQIDELSGLDRKTLPFSYLVLTKSKRSQNEILPLLHNNRNYRLVSPNYRQSSSQEFYLCGEEGKFRCRITQSDQKKNEQLEKLAETLSRGSILTDAQFHRGNPARISSTKDAIL